MPKIMGEIIKNGQTYKIEPVQQIDMGKAYDELLLYAKGEDYITTYSKDDELTQIVDLGTKPFDSVKVYFEKSAEPEIEPPKVEEPAEEGGNKVTTFGTAVYYLGQKLFVRVKHIFREGSSYAMLLDIGDRDPLAVVSESGCLQILDDALGNQGFKGVYVVVPPGQMEAEDRATYLEEYVDSIVKQADELKERGSKTATAWNGWNDPGNKQQEDGEA